VEETRLFLDWGQTVRLSFFIDANLMFLSTRKMFASIRDLQKGFHQSKDRGASREANSQIS